MGVLLRWGWVLGVALLAPAALPAGGGERRQPEIRRSDSSGPLFAGTSCELRVSPLAVAPSLRRLAVGTPLNVLRRWHGDDGKDWLQVQIASGSGECLAGVVRRGWLNV